MGKTEKSQPRIFKNREEMCPRHGQITRNKPKFAKGALTGMRREGHSCSFPREESLPVDVISILCLLDELRA